ncbi:VTT domain-containing protein [Lamprobacter modestohalophilus]|uniref:VTT domain-containing protein n=1 Tax=Lamprobacter modestohalophilus TaxID=1064514 RepID=UPI002ADED5BD|nr:VTT domain-containing protein [Lamprobacter modestohalophilus]MEA1049873.1 VTT domain-containing protein [Lamprobacter modestohalophilus]
MKASTTTDLRLVAGRNCWRVETARRVGLCVDGECYFGMLRQSLIAARRFIAITAWDLHSQLELVRPDPQDGWPTAFGDLLLRLLELRPELEIFILLWDYAPIYALEREPLFFGEVPWHKDADKRHPRLHFILDDVHPLMASQHQKLVLIDGALAWCGGFDISKWRWDTEAHRADEPRRRDPSGDPYPPFHDLQLLVDGDAASALLQLFAERWERAGGGVPQVLHSGSEAATANVRAAEVRAADVEAADVEAADVGGGDDDGADDAWPAQLEPILHEQAVGIARTLPLSDGRAEVRESEQLYLDMIAAARDLIYIENQYLTSRSVAEALERRLAQPEGPLILIILPRETGHWLEQHTMDLIRARILKRLRDADRHGRLHCYYPDLPALGDKCLMVHAKLMIIDDRVLRIGSSNLSNRSMGLDSECDLCLVGDTEAACTEIQRLRRRLLAMFLSIDPETLADLEAECRRSTANGKGSAAIDLAGALAQLVDGGGAGAKAAAEEQAEADGSQRDALASQSGIGADRRPDRGADRADAETEGSPRNQARPGLRLRRLEPSIDPEWDRQVPDERLIDPDRPLAPDWVGDVVVGEEHQPHARWRALLGVGLLLTFLVLAALWRWTPVGDWLEPQRLAEAARALTHSLWGVPVALSLFVIASVAAVPVTLLILVTTLVFDPLPGALIALGGSALAAVAGYQIGHFTGAGAAEKRLGGRLNDLRQRLATRGIFTVMVLRIVPVAPFAVLNLIAGAIQVRFRDYLIGTLVGMAPAVIAMALFSQGLLQLLGRTDMRSLAFLLGGILIGAGLLWLGRHLLRKSD